jgi:CheY-like chemotaxis protein
LGLQHITALRILIVGDSHDMREFISRVVRLSGTDVEQYYEAANGEEALAQLSRHSIDVVLADGEELVRQIRATPVIMVCDQPFGPEELRNELDRLKLHPSIASPHQTA